MIVAVPALIPPFRFSAVQEGLYRGSYPTLKNFRFLKRLQLKTIVSVVPEPPTTDLAAFCAAEGIINYHFFAEKFTSDSVTVSPATVSQIVQLIIKQENLPLYLHCLDGANVTGIIVMVLRKLQNWTKVATLFEFCRSVTCATFVVGLIGADLTRSSIAGSRATTALRRTSPSTWRAFPRRLW